MMEIKQINLEGARIVEFESKFAASVADMWNASAEGWNGDMWDMTEQKVLNEELNADSLVLYLLIDDNEKVIGYCKLEEYNDKKAVYIPLLNVIPEFWGRKYGKALLLKTLETTIKQGYNRLDLHSWSGNTKAVPLYKKTGFRWQTGNSSMYMMNYLPLLLNLELLQPYFAKLDWYNDFDCDLALEPDGNMENGFEFFHYCWKKDDRYLEAVFDANVKGLCRVKCNDFELNLKAADKKVYYGKREVQLELKNNLADPLIIKIEMSGEADIEIDEKREITLSGSRTETFWIEVKDDFERKGHECPAVIANVKINGKLIPLKLGLNPQAPVQVALKAEIQRLYRPGNIDLYLQLRNNLKETKQLSTELKDTEFLHFYENEISIELKPKETKTIKLQARLEKGCFYDERINIKLHSEIDNITYVQRLRAAIPDLNSIIYGSYQEYSILQNGPVFLKCNHTGNYYAMSLNVLNTDYWLVMKLPRLCEPLDKEFLHAVHDKISFEELADSVVMRVQFTSKNGQLQVSHLFKLRYDNVLEHNWEIENISGENIDVKHLETAYGSAATHALYDGKMLQMTLEEKNRYWFGLKADQITSGWSYYLNEGLSVAMLWDSQHEFKFGEWWQRVLYKVGALEANETRTIYGETIMLNHFLNWQEYYHWYFGNRDYPDIIRIKELKVNDGNPFCGKQIEVRYSDIHDSMDEKTIRLMGDGEQLHEEHYISGVWQKKIAHHNKVTLEIEEASKKYSYKQNTFLNCPQSMQFSLHEQSGKQIIVLKGEKLEMQTSAEFFPGVFSLKYKGKELLSSSFPETIIRGWQNHWRGGISIIPNGVSSAILEQQKVDVKQEERLDNFGNIWQGFSYAMKFNEKVPVMDGVTMQYNYLVSPSQNVLAIFCEMIDTGGAYFTGFYASAGININEEQPVNFNCDNTILKVSERSMRKGNLSFASAKLDNCNYLMNFYTSKNHLCVTVGSQMGAVSDNFSIFGVEPGKIKASQPLYLVISEKKVSADELKILKNIKWS
ncbi:MAG: GNAT family N-acetyltransferase [Candidatus Stygibacter australis]|nr:GNAT family N-acetyltransferase [Candidatus Stygibacter australis]